jgi:tetratricopeptide (TPR) repeat protein
MYWYATNFGLWATDQGMSVVLLHKDMIRKVMERCLALDPDYFYAAPHRYFGAFYAKAPAFAGGDMDKAKQHFEEAIARHPAYLGTLTRYAEFYAVKLQDRDLFRRLLNQVLAADENALPEVAAENAIEKKKAKALLGRENELL